MIWIGDYFNWMFGLGFIDIAFMLAVTGSVAFVALTAVIWVMVGIKWALGIGQFRRRPDTPRRAAKRQRLNTISELHAQGHSARQIREMLQRS